MDTDEEVNEEDSPKKFEEQVRLDGHNLEDQSFKMFDDMAEEDLEEDGPSKESEDLEDKEEE